MKALSIRQPWAWLIVNGHKDIENRDWPTRVRGTVFVHAGKTIDEEALRGFRLDCPWFKIPEILETGGIVGQMDIVDCVTDSESEWFEGDYGFVIENGKPLPFRPLRGQLGFFEVSNED